MSISKYKFNPSILNKESNVMVNVNNKDSTLQIIIKDPNINLYNTTHVELSKPNLLAIKSYTGHAIIEGRDLEMSTNLGSPLLVYNKDLPDLYEKISIVLKTTNDTYTI